MLLLALDCGLIAFHGGYVSYRRNASSRGAGGVWAGAPIDAILGVVFVALTWKFVGIGLGKPQELLWRTSGAYGVHVVTHALVSAKVT